MDKAEYRSKLEQINELAEAGDFRAAADAANEIDWRHVKSVRTLSMIGEIYEANKQYEESRRILKYAYRRSASSKTVLYRLAELDIRTGNYDEAKKFINEFEQNSPNDTSRYILKYKLLRAEKAPLDDQIAVLRDYKDTEYTERWAYELAKLYKKNGQNEKCVEECDDMILWFSEGKYVQKAMELKMSLTDLTPSQKAMYEDGVRRAEEAKRLEAEEKAAEAAEAEQAKKKAKEEESGGDTRELNAMEIVEKAVLEAEDEDEESKPKVSAGEAITKMDTAAAGLAAAEQGAKEELAEKEAAAPKKKENAERLQDRIANGLRAVFAGKRREEEAPDIKIADAPGMDEIVIPEDVAEAASETAEGEVSGTADAVSGAASEAAKKAAGAVSDAVSEVSEKTAGAAEKAADATEAAAEKAAGVTETAAEKAADAAEAAAEKAAGTVESVTEAAAGKAEDAAEAAAEAVESVAEAAAGKAEDTVEAAAETVEEAAETTNGGIDSINLDELFAETGSALASEVASGNYMMADTLESERAEAEERIERKRAENAATIPEEIEIPVAETADEEAGHAETAAEGTRSAEADAIFEELEIPDESEAVEAARQTAAEASSDLADIEAELKKAAEEAAETRTLATDGDEGLSEAEAEEKEFEKKKDDSNLYARETDESLGLTREFHIKEIDRILAEREEKAAEGGEEEKPVIVSPEQAARKAVIEANGGVYDPEAELREAAERSEDEANLRSAAEDEAVRQELLAEEELPEIPDEVSQDALMNLTEAVREEESGAPESIYEAPEYFTMIPVEGRELTADEKKVFSYFASIPGVDYQVTSAIADVHNNCGDKTSRSGNILIVGRQGSGKTRLAEGLVRAICLNLGLKAAREAKIVADDFNEKDPAAVVKKLAGGFLIIEAAGSLSEDAVARLNQAMEFRTDDLIVILEDEKADLTKLLGMYPDFAAKFTSTITVPVFTNDELVSFGKVYADEEGYRLDEMATLALYTMIGDNQKDAEPVTVGMVRQMVDNAIDKSSRKFRFGKPEREEGRLILREKDFNF